MSSKEKSYVEDGFLANTREEEKKCQTQIADVLTAMEDITPKVAQATAGKGEKDANEARKTALTQLESGCEKNEKLKCESVNLYQGGQYWLYKYKRYTDVRIAFAPEVGIAAVRRRPGQLPVPALVPRHGHPARLRERQAREAC